MLRPGNEGRKEEQPAIIKDLQKCITPEELRITIEKCLDQRADNDLILAYEEARNAVRRLRTVAPALLPSLPKRYDNPLAGLENCTEWCHDATAAIHDMRNKLDPKMLVEISSLLGQLKELLWSCFPHIDTDVFAKAQQRAGRILEKFHARLHEEYRKHDTSVPKQDFIATVRKEMRWDSHLSAHQKYHNVGGILSQLVELARKTKGRNSPYPQLEPMQSSDSSMVGDLTRMEELLSIGLPFMKTVEKIYRVMDKDYDEGILKLESKITGILNELDQLRSTPAGKLLDAYDTLIKMELQTRFFTVQHAYSIDSIVESMIRQSYTYNRFGTETREELVDGVIADIEKILEGLQKKQEDESKRINKSGDLNDTDLHAIFLDVKGQHEQQIEKNEYTSNEQQLAEQIIQDLNEWASVGSDNWEKKRPTGYYPNGCLDYRFSIRNKLWMESILLKLMQQDKNSLANDIEQWRDKLNDEINAFDKNLDPADPMHLPNCGLSLMAGRLTKALQYALPCLGTQLPNPTNKQSIPAIVERSIEADKENDILSPSITRGDRKRGGKMWEFCFERKTMSLPYYAGFDIIELLLKNPNRKFLRYEVNAELLKLAMGMDVCETITPQEIYEANDRKSIEKDIESLELRRDRTNDPVEKAELQEQIDRSRKILQNATKIKKKQQRPKSRTFGTVRGMTKNHEKALQYLEANFPELYNHLKAWMHVGEVSSYIPDHEIIWHIS